MLFLNLRNEISIFHTDTVGGQAYPSSDHQLQDLQGDLGQACANSLKKMLCNPCISCRKTITA